jgi:two-component system, cell cycle sensor histidine kinase and response regulator CckA
MNSKNLKRRAGKHKTGDSDRIRGGARQLESTASRTNEDIYRDLVEHSEDLICTHDLNGKLLSINALPLKVLGYSQEELLNRPMQEFLAPEMRPLFGEYLSQIQRDGVAEGLMVVLTKKGEPRTWEYHNTLRTEGVANPIVRGIAHDITERRNIERALRHSEEKFSKAFRSNPCPMAITTLSDGRFMEVNDIFVQHLGFTREEIVGHTSAELELWVDPSEREKVLALIGVNGSVHNLDLTFRKKSGEPMVTEYSAELIELNGKQCLLAVGKDVSQRRALEHALTEQATYLETLIQENPIALTVSDSNNRLRMSNRAFEQLFWYTSEEIKDVDLDDLLTTDDQALEARETSKLVMSGKQVNFTTKRRRKDNQLLDVEIRAVPLTVLGKTVGCYVSYLDLTERNRLQDQLIQAQRMEAIALLAAGIAHDFNNILTAVLGFGELLTKSLDPGSKPHARAQEIVSAAIRGRLLTSQLLAFSYPRECEPRTIDPGDELTDLVPMLAPILGEDIQLNVSIDPDTGHVRIAPGRLLQIVMNLAVNARDAMPSGGTLTIKTSRTVAEVNPDSLNLIDEKYGYVLISVTDTGCGMDEQTRNRVFEPFFTTKGTGLGTGLGLATVARIVAASGGKIDVASAKNEGSTFNIYLPRTDEPVVHVLHKQMRAPSASIIGTVLLVEDDEFVRRLVLEMLADRGCKVLCATNPTQAISIAEGYEGDIDLFLSDIVMPTMSGPDLGLHLKPYFPQMKMIFMTGYADERLLNHVRRRQDLVILHKPFKPEELLHQINLIVGSKDAVS